MTSSVFTGRRDPIEGLIQFVEDFKPYHTKIVDVIVTNVTSDDINVSFEENLFMDILIEIKRTNIECPTGFGLAPFGKLAVPAAEFTFPVLLSDSVGETFTVGGDKADIFIPGQIFSVTGSASNNGSFAVDSSIDDGFTVTDPGAPNTGDGTVKQIDGSEFYPPVETWTLTATNPTTFTVTGSVSGAQANATVGVPYDNGIIKFTIAAGLTPFVAGDDFDILVTGTNTTTITITGNVVASEVNMGTIHVPISNFDFPEMCATLSEGTVFVTFDESLIILLGDEEVDLFQYFDFVNVQVGDWSPVGFGGAQNPLQFTTDFTTDTGTLTQTDGDTFVKFDLFTGTGIPVFVASDGTLPAPLAPDTAYYLIRLSETTFKLAASLVDAINNTPIDITDNGVGTHTVDVHIPLPGFDDQGFDTQDGVRWTIDMVWPYAQTLITTVPDVAGSLSGTYFLLSSATNDYYVWYNVGGGSTDPGTTEPDAGGRTGIQVNITANDNVATIAAATAVAIDAQADLSAEVLKNGTVIITFGDRHVEDGSGFPTGFTFQSRREEIRTTLLQNAPLQGTAGFQIVDVGGNVVGTDATGLANDATVYTATITIDGEAKAIAVTGSTAQTYASLLTEIQTDLDVGTRGATVSLTNGNIFVTSNSFGNTSTVSIVDVDLFSSLTTFVAINSAIPGATAGVSQFQGSPYTSFDTTSSINERIIFTVEEDGQLVGPWDTSFGWDIGPFDLDWGAFDSTINIGRYPT